jgi:hypothetical protein
MEQSAAELGHNEFYTGVQPQPPERLPSGTSARQKAVSTYMQQADLLSKWNAYHMLPATEKNRISRAIEQGFTVDAFHGASQAHGGKNFDPGLLGANTQARSAREGFFFSADAQTANSPYYTQGEQMLSAQASKRLEEIDQRRRALEQEIWFARREKARQQWLSEHPGQSLPQHLRYPFGDLENSTPVPLEALYKEEQDLLDEVVKIQEAEISGANIIPVRLKMKNPYIKDCKGQGYRDINYTKVIKTAKELGHDSVILKNTPDGGPVTDVYVVFDPKQIRSRFALYDPAAKDSGDILASVAFPLGMGAAAEAFLADKRDKRRGGATRSWDPGNQAAKAEATLALGPEQIVASKATQEALVNKAKTFEGVETPLGRIDPVAAGATLVSNVGENISGLAALPRVGLALAKEVSGPPKITEPWKSPSVQLAHGTKEALKTNWDEIKDKPLEWFQKNLDIFLDPTNYLMAGFPIFRGKKHFQQWADDLRRGEGAVDRKALTRALLDPEISSVEAGQLQGKTLGEYLYPTKNKSTADIAVRAALPPDIEDLVVSHENLHHKLMKLYQTKQGKDVLITAAKNVQEALADVYDSVLLRDGGVTKESYSQAIQQQFGVPKWSSTYIVDQIYNPSLGKLVEGSGIASPLAESSEDILAEVLGSSSVVGLKTRNPARIGEVPKKTQAVIDQALAQQKKSGKQTKKGPVPF